MAAPQKQITDIAPDKEGNLFLQQGLAKEGQKLITDFTYPKDLASFNWKADLSNAEDDFSRAYSSTGAPFKILKGPPGPDTTEQSERPCLIKIRGFERQPILEEKQKGISKVEIISANMWIDGEMACRTDMTIKYYSDGKVVGDMMTATSNLDKSDPQLCEMDKATRYDANGNPALNGFWSNRKLSYHAREGGTIEWMGRSLLAMHTKFGKARGMTSFQMRTPTEHERKIVEEFYLKRGAAVNYVGADLQEPFGLEVSKLDRLEPLKTEIYERSAPWKPENGAPPAE